jgi:hypothetical protein
MAIFSFGGLRGLLSGYVGCLWMQLFSAVSLTPAINLCHGFSLIGGVVDTGEKLLLVTTTPPVWHCLE